MKTGPVRGTRGTVPLFIMGRIDMAWFAASPVLAAGLDSFALRMIVFVMIMVVGTILKKLAERKEKANRPKPAKPPAPPVARENQFRSEIEAFLDEVGRRRSPSDMRRPEMTGATPLAPQRNAPRPRPELPKPTRPAASQVPARLQPAASTAAKNTPPKRPGSEMANRKAPVSQDLGKQVRAHVAQIDQSRLTQKAQADVGNAVEQAVRNHLGETITRGTANVEQAPAGLLAASTILALLRSKDGMRTAIVVNEILGPPKALRRKS